MSDTTASDSKYDLYSQSTKNNPYPIFERMRRDDAVFAQPGADGTTMIWFLTRYDDVAAMLRNDALFVRDERSVYPPDENYQFNPLDALLNNHMLNKDGSEHRRLRNLVSKGFTPARIKALRPRIQSIADELLDAVHARGEMDLMADYAFHVPTIVISELLGVPVEERERFKAWSNAFITPTFDAESQARAGALLQEFIEYLGALFVARRQAPRDDLISALLRAQEAGDQLSEAELFSTVVLLIVAGHETTVNLIGNATLALLREPEKMQLLANNSDKMAAAVEEFLRYDGPVERSLVRFAAQDTTVGGHRIRRGDLLIGVLNSANRDAEQFAHPEQLDVERGPQRHLAFGHGVHYCLGAPLARLEGEIALSTLLRRLPALRLAAPQSELAWRTVPMFRGLVALPVAWTP